MKAEQEFAAYLKNKPAFMPLLEALKTRWNHSGTWRGKLVLHECDPSLQEALAELLGGSFWGTVHDHAHLWPMEKGVKPDPV